MKLFALLVSCMFSLESFSQYFTFSDIIEHDMYETESKFPLVKSTSNPKAAERINTYLHFAELTKVLGKDEGSIFSNVFPTEEAFWGQTGFSYDVFRNDETFLSIGISYDNTGAYSEYYTDYFTFISKTGEHVLLEDFFAPTPLVTIGEIINDRCADQIGNFMEGIDLTQEDASEMYEMYGECFENRTGSDYVYSGNFRMEKEGMVFILERCSNHMMAALDELWVFEELLTYDILTNFFNQNGIDSYETGIWSSSDAVTLNDKVLVGTINNSYPITAKFHVNHNESEVSGVYWYNKVKNELHVRGTINEDGIYELTEYNRNEEVTGFFTGEVEGGKFSGTWENKDHSKSMPFILSLF